MKYQVPERKIASTYNLGNDDTKAIFEAVIDGMTIAEAARAQVEGYAEYPFDDERFEKYWNIDKAAEIFAAEFRKDIKKSATSIWAMSRYGNKEVKYDHDYQDDEGYFIRVLVFDGSEIHLRLAQDVEGDPDGDDVVILIKDRQ